MFDYACIYSPDLGDDEHVEQQLVFTKGQQSVDEFVKLIGVAQGIAELAYSFDQSSPAKWFKTGRGATAKLIIIVPLTNSSGDWRSGYWFAGQAPLSTSVLPPEAMYRHIKLAYEQYHFLNGHANKTWPDLTTFEPLDLCTVVAPNAIRLAPGTLSPTSRNGIEHIRTQAGAADVIITTVDDGSAVWPGQHLNVDTRIRLQRWLARKTNRTAINKTVTQETQQLQEPVQKTQDPQESQAGEAHERAEPPQDAPQNEQEAVAEHAVDQPTDTPTPQGDTEPHTTQEQALETPQDEQAAPEASLDSPHQAREAPSSSSWFTMPEMSNLSMPNLSMSNISSMTMSSLPSLPTMSMSNMPSVNEYIPSVSSAFRSWWDSGASGPAEEDGDETGFLYSDLEIYDAVEDRKWYVTAYRRALFVYFMVYPEPAASKAAPKPLMSHFEALVAQLEGFSFAFAPPTRFNYLILDNSQRTVTSTFPNTLSTDILGTLLSPRKEKPQVVRVGSTWLYFVSMKNGAEAVFGKKGLSSQQGSLLGALHSDVEQWLSDYERRAN